MPNFFTRNKTLKDSGNSWVVEEIKNYAWTSEGNDNAVGEGQRNVKPDRYAAMRESEWQWQTQSPVNCKRSKTFVMVSSTRLTLNIFKTTPPEEFFRCSLRSLVYQKSWLTWSETIFIYLFIYNNFICNNQYKKAAIREELNPHVRWPPKNIYKAIKEI